MFAGGGRNRGAFASSNLCSCSSNLLLRVIPKIPTDKFIIIELPFSNWFVLDDQYLGWVLAACSYFI